MDNGSDRLGFDLIHITNSDRLETINMLVQHTMKIGENWRYIYIGKTHVVAKKAIPFNKEKQFTWDLKAIKGRQFDHLNNKGLTNLTVIAVITKTEVPASWSLTTEQYALSLESEIISRLASSEIRSKLLNETSDPGGLTKRNCDGFVIYVAHSNTRSSTVHIPQFASSKVETAMLATSQLYEDISSPEQSYEMEDVPSINSTETETAMSASSQLYEDISSPEQSYEMEDVPSINSTETETAMSASSQLYEDISSPEQSYEMEDIPPYDETETAMSVSRNISSPEQSFEEINFPTNEINATVSLPIQTNVLQQFMSENVLRRPAVVVTGSSLCEHTARIPARNSPITSSRTHCNNKPNPNKSTEKTSVVFYGIVVATDDHGKSHEAYMTIKHLIKTLLPQIDASDWKAGKWIVKPLNKRSRSGPILVDFHSEQTRTEVLNNEHLFLTQGIKLTL